MLERWSDATLRCAHPRSSVSIRGLIAIAILCAPQALFACATCYGQSDAPLAQGMNLGIVTLLGIITSVLAGIVVFFVHVGRRSSWQHSAPQSGSQPENR